MMEEEAKRKLKAAELQAKKDRIRLWINYVPPATNSQAIHNQNFTGKVRDLCCRDIPKYLMIFGDIFSFSGS